MLSKNKIKIINQLKQKKYRQQYGLFFVEGSRNTLDFINSNMELTDLYATENWINENLSVLKKVDHTIVTVKELKKISSLTNPSEVLSLFRIPEQQSKPKLATDAISLVLDDIHDPGNLGTIIRTADWFGIKNIYCSENTVDATNPKVVQASMGSLSRVNIYYTNLEKLLSDTPDNYKVMGAFLNGKPLNEMEPAKCGAIIIGSEAHGISNNLKDVIDTRITIPLVASDDTSQPESLNASVACAVICYALKISN